MNIGARGQALTAHCFGGYGSCIAGGVGRPQSD